MFNVAERAAQWGLCQNLCDATQMAALVELLKTACGRRRIPVRPVDQPRLPGVDEAAYVSAAGFPAAKRERRPPPLVSPEKPLNCQHHAGWLQHLIR